MISSVTFAVLARISSLLQSNKTITMYLIDKTSCVIVNYHCAGRLVIFTENLLNTYRIIPKHHRNFKNQIRDLL